MDEIKATPKTWTEQLIEGAQAYENAMTIQDQAAALELLISCIGRRVQSDHTQMVFYAEHLDAVTMDCTYTTFRCATPISLIGFAAVIERWANSVLYHGE